MRTTNMPTMNASATLTHPPHARRVLRGIGAVLAGVLANIVLAGTIDFALYATRVYPPMFQPMPDQLWALALAYRVVIAVIGGFLTARLAPAWPMRHVMALGGIETALSALCVVANWNKVEFGPHWFAISVAVSSLPLAALGGVPGAKQIPRVNQ
jgi:hypothetical protein